MRTAARAALAAAVLSLLLTAEGNRRVRRPAPSRSRSGDDDGAFGPDGRMPQVDYAEVAVAKGALSVAVATTDGVLIAIEAEPTSPLRLPLRPMADPSLDSASTTSSPNPLDKLLRVSPSCVAVSAGRLPDAVYLVDEGRSVSAEFWEKFGRDPGGRRLSAKLAQAAARYDARFGGRGRPLGCALLLADVDAEVVHVVRPSGTAESGRALAIGRGADAVLRHLGATLGDGAEVSAAEAKRKCLEAYAKAGGGVRRNGAAAPAELTFFLARRGGGVGLGDDGGDGDGDGDQVPVMAVPGMLANDERERLRVLPYADE